MFKELLNQSEKGMDKRQRKLLKLMNSLSEFIQPYFHAGEEVCKEIDRAIETHKISTEVIPEIGEVEYILTKWLIAGRCRMTEMLDAMGKMLYAMISFADEVASDKRLLSSITDSDLNKVDTVCRIRQAMVSRMSAMADMCGDLNVIGELLQSSFDTICNPTDANLHEKELRLEYYKAMAKGDEAAVQSTLEKLDDIKMKRLDSILNNYKANKKKLSDARALSADIKRLSEAKLLCAESDAFRSRNPEYRRMQESLNDAVKMLTSSEFLRASQSIDAAMRDLELTDEAATQNCELTDEAATRDCEFSDETDSDFAALFDRYDKAITEGNEAEAMVVRKKLENYDSGLMQDKETAEKNTPN